MLNIQNEPTNKISLKIVRQIKFLQNMKKCSSKREKYSNQQSEYKIMVYILPNSYAYAYFFKHKWDVMYVHYVYLVTSYFLLNYESLFLLINTYNCNYIIVLWWIYIKSFTNISNNAPHHTHTWKKKKKVKVPNKELSKAHLSEEVGNTVSPHLTSWVGSWKLKL